MNKLRVSSGVRTPQSTLSTGIAIYRTLCCSPMLHAPSFSTTSGDWGPLLFTGPLLYVPEEIEETQQQSGPLQLSSVVLLLLLLQPLLPRLLQLLLLLLLQLLL